MLRTHSRRTVTLDGAKMRLLASRPLWLSECSKDDACMALEQTKQIVGGLFRRPKETVPILLIGIAIGVAGMWLQGYLGELGRRMASPSTADDAVTGAKKSLITGGAVLDVVFKSDALPGLQASGPVGGSMVLKKGNRTLVTLGSVLGSGFATTNHEWICRQTFDLGLPESVANVPQKDLLEVDRIEVTSPLWEGHSQVTTGSAVFVFNNALRFLVKIPPYSATNGTLVVTGVQDSLSVQNQ